MNDTKPRPPSKHDRTCREVRWVHHMPWQIGEPVLAVCLGCTAVKRIDGGRIRLVEAGPALAGAR